MTENKNKIFEVSLYTKKLTTFATFAISNEYKNIIASIQYRDNYHFELNNTNLERLVYFNNLAFEGSGSQRSYKIIHVVPEKVKEPFPLISKENVNLDSNFTLPFSNYNNPDPSSLFFDTYQKDFVLYAKIYKHNFFTEEFIQKYIFDRKKDLIEYIFIFENMQWKTLVDSFKSLNIILSGGSTVSRHVLTSVQINLARFILGLEGLNESHQISQSSFKLHKKLHTNLRLENFVKDRKIRLILEYLKYFNNQVEYNRLVINLYVLYKNSPLRFDFILVAIAWGNEHLYKDQPEIVYEKISNVLENSKLYFEDFSKEGDILCKIQSLDSKLYYTNKKENNFAYLLKEISEYVKFLNLHKKKGMAKWMNIELGTNNLEYKEKNENWRSLKKGEKEFNDFISKVFNKK